MNQQQVTISIKWKFVIHRIFGSILAICILTSCERKFREIKFHTTGDRMVYSDSMSTQWRKIFDVVNSESENNISMLRRDSIGELQFIESNWKEISFGIYRSGDTLQALNIKTNSLSPMITKATGPSCSLLFNLVQGVGVKRLRASISAKYIPTMIIDSPKPQLINFPIKNNASQK